MKMRSLLFSFEGRISRAEFWRGFLLGVLPIACVLIGLTYLSLEAQVGWPFFLGVPLDLIGFWIEMALIVKRLHDRNRSAWWICFGFIPLVGPIWGFIEIGILPSDTRVNKWGSPPLP